MQAPAQATHTQGCASQLQGAQASKHGEVWKRGIRGGQRRGKWDQRYKKERKRVLGGRWRKGNEGSGGWRIDREEVEDIRFIPRRVGERIEHVCTWKGKDGSCLGGSMDKFA